MSASAARRLLCERVVRHAGVRTGRTRPSWPRSKYQFMEAQLQGTRSRLKAKYPDIKASLEALELLKAKKVGGLAGWCAAAAALATMASVRVGLCRRDIAMALPAHTQAAGESVSTFYNLSEQVHVAATVEPSAGVVCLWMGVGGHDGLGSRSRSSSTLRQQRHRLCVPAPAPVWMQANVMLEYTYDEAESLLKENLAAAQAKLVSA